MKFIIVECLGLVEHKNIQEQVYFMVQEPNGANSYPSPPLNYSFSTPPAPEWGLVFSPSHFQQDFGILFG